MQFLGYSSFYNFEPASSLFTKSTPAPLIIKKLKKIGKEFFKFMLEFPLNKE